MGDSVCSSCRKAATRVFDAACASTAAPAGRQSLDAAELALDLKAVNHLNAFDKGTWQGAGGTEIL